MFKILVALLTRPDARYILWRHLTHPGRWTLGECAGISLTLAALLLLLFWPQHPAIQVSQAPTSGILIGEGTSGNMVIRGNVFSGTPILGPTLPLSSSGALTCSGYPTYSAPTGISLCSSGNNIATRGNDNPIKVTSGGTSLVTLPAHPLVGQRECVKDVAGHAATENIYVRAGDSNVLIDGTHSTVFVLNQNYQAICFVSDGEKYYLEW